LFFVFLFFVLFFLLLNRRATIRAFISAVFWFSVSQIHTAPPSTQVHHRTTSPWLTLLTHPAFWNRHTSTTFSADRPQPKGATTCWPSLASVHRPEAPVSFPLLLRCEECFLVQQERKSVCFVSKQTKEFVWCGADARYEKKGKKN